MTTRPKTARTSPAKVPPIAELPVTRAMLYGVRDELVARSDQTNARIDLTNARIEQTNNELHALLLANEAFKVEMRHEFDAFRAEMRAANARVQTIAEDQDARNRVVLEVVQGHNARFDRIEADVAELKGLLHEIVRALANRT